jgi:hypothetical protein
MHPHSSYDEPTEADPSAPTLPQPCRRGRLLHCLLTHSQAIRQRSGAPEPLSGATMEANPIEALITPYTRLAQANAELLKNLPQAASIAPQAYTSVQDSVSASPDAATPLPSAYADMALRWMVNWTTYWTDLSQALVTLFRQGQQAWLDQYRDGTGASEQPSDTSQERTRRGRATH